MLVSKPFFVRGLQRTDSAVVELDHDKARKSMSRLGCKSRTGKKRRVDVMCCEGSGEFGRVDFDCF